MNKKSKYIAFRCPPELYEEMLEKEKNMSKLIKNALKSYKGKDLQNDLRNAYTQLSKLFHAIGLHFDNRNTLGTNEFINFINAYITDTKVIDKIEEIIK